MISRCPCCGQEADFHGLRFDETINVVWIDGKGLRLWEPTFQILLVLQNGDSIASEVLAKRMNLDMNNLRSYIRHLRLELKDTPYYILNSYRAYQLKRMKQWAGPA